MSEESLHRAIVQYLRFTLPHGWLVHHCANKPRSKIAGGIEKALGAIAGWPDIAIYGRPDDEPGVYFLEVKAPTGRVSDVQHDVHDRLKDIGFPVAVVRSLEDVRAFVRSHGLPSRDEDLRAVRVTLTPEGA